jgi:peptidoglycan/LPS O-acetylase OafA/YrhL
MEARIVQQGTEINKTNASVLLDLARGIAAVLVLLQHWRNIFFIDYPQISAHRPLFALPYLLTSAGHQAVVIFFVMSGYLITGSIFRMLERGTWSWITYLLHRLIRLWVVLLPGLVLCLFWDHIGLHTHLAPALYSGVASNHMTPNVGQGLTLKIFIENVFFLQGVTTTALGSDVALWSLSNEFWYYLLFPLGLFAVYRAPNFKISLGSRVLCAVTFLALAWFLRTAILLLFPIWLGGALLTKLPVLRIGTRTRLVSTAAYVAIIFYFARGRPNFGTNPDYILGIFTALFFWIVLSAQGKAKPSPGVHASRELARFSYTLYVVHMPFLVLIVALVVGDGRWTPNLPHFLEGCGILLLTLVYAYGVASLTEFRTDTLRRWIEARFNIGGRDTSTAVSRN